MIGQPIGVSGNAGRLVAEAEAEARARIGFDIGRRIMIEAEPVDRTVNARKVAGLHVRLHRRLHQAADMSRGIADRDRPDSNRCRRRAAACASAGVDGRQGWKLWMAPIELPGTRARTASTAAPWARFTWWMARCSVSTPEVSRLPPPKP